MADRHFQQLGNVNFPRIGDCNTKRSAGHVEVGHGPSVGVGSRTYPLVRAGIDWIRIGPSTVTTGEQNE